MIIEKYKVYDINEFLNYEGKNKCQIILKMQKILLNI